MAGTHILGRKPDGTVGAVRLDATGALLCAMATGTTPAPVASGAASGVHILAKKPDGTIAAVRLDATGALVLGTAGG